jgi:hypothetical protein
MPRAVIRSNRAEVSSRFPLLGFSVRTGSNPYFEVALATDPSLFTDKARRTTANFYSTHGLGPLSAESGEAIYLVPDQVLRRFVGQDRIYYAIATFADRSRAKPEVALLPGDTAPFVSVSRSFSGRVLRQTVGAGVRARGDGDYAADDGKSLEWAGDAARPGGEPVTPRGAATDKAAKTDKGGPPAAAAALAYDDGYSDKLWSSDRADAGARFAGKDFAGKSAQSFDVGWADVQVVPQQDNDSCWAAAAAMVIGWRDRGSVDRAVVARMVAPLVDAKGRVPRGGYGALANALQLEAEDPQSYGIDAFRELLEARGPLMVTASVPSEHVVVVTGIYGDGTPDGTYVRINDPWGRATGTPGAPGAYNPTPGQGSQYVLTYRQFAGEYDAAAELPNANLQILHVRERDMEGHVPLVTSQAFAYWRAITSAKSSALAVPVLVPIASAIVGAVMNRVLNNEGDIHWELDQLQGLKHPNNNAAQAGDAEYTTTTTTVAEWPYVENYLGDRISADFEIVWQHNGKSLGNIEISNTRTNDAVGWGLDVKANIMDDAVVHDGKAAVRVRFYYRFNRSIGSDLIAISDYTLFGDGTFTRSARWTQGAEAEALGNGDGVSTRALAAPVIVPIAATILGTAMTRVFNNEGDVKWELDQMRGMKHVGDDAANRGKGTPTWITTKVEGWPQVENYLSDQISADFEIKWQYDGRSLGNISITNTNTNDAVGWGLDVKAQIMDDAAAYTRPGNPDQFAAAQVQFYYRFNRSIGSDVIAIADYTLYGDGSIGRTARWTQT